MKNKILIGLAIVIVVGAIIIATLGFNVDTSYKGYNIIDVDLGQEFNINDIKAITNDVFGKSKAEVQKGGDFRDVIIIKVTSDISDEQKEQLINKINEKYGTEKTVADINAVYIPRFKLIDVAKPYIFPVIASAVLILIYMAIRFRKLGTVKVLSQAISLTAIAELLYFALIAITRYPVNKLLMPVAVVIYITIISTEMCAPISCL